MSEGASTSEELKNQPNISSPSLSVEVTNPTSEQFPRQSISTTKQEEESNAISPSTTSTKEAEATDRKPLSEADILLEEWKKNVDLYIDQDKRGFARIGIFILIHAGLLAFYENVYEKDLLVTCAIAGVGIYLTWITMRMSNRAHECIILRRIQGLLIENKLKSLIQGQTDLPWKTSSGIITTFTREHVAFRKIKDDKEKSWNSLKEEIEDIGKHSSRIFKKKFFLHGDHRYTINLG